VTDCKDI